MSTEFVVGGEVKKLSMIDPKSGTDVAADFIGNTAHGMQSDAEGRYIATLEDFEWWQNTIAAHLEMGALIAQYREKYIDQADVDEWLQEMSAFDCDLEDQPASVKRVLKMLDD